MRTPHVGNVPRLASEGLEPGLGLCVEVSPAGWRHGLSVAGEDERERRSPPDGGCRDGSYWGRKGQEQSIGYSRRSSHETRFLGSFERENVCWRGRMDGLWW